uniref:Uncharacterized protein n=1 Tax=Amphora coffeiformis TaxID=265554 RepID=A0A7S3L5J2_9STRA|mmetsp:Transcript_1733/g.3787  ORF Transcript_1733/g.3787 Transcript_1733/m.3787 type:complete len:560 (-) Transcript_1733:70-1749(-)|eukprot:scaffold38043_cov176-Amphora_coffeaeformis.AAC.5
MTIIHSLSLGLTVLWTRLTMSTAYDGLHGYTALNPEVEDLANISRDLYAMHEELKKFKREEEGKAAAYKIYRYGGYSRSVCTLDLLDGLPDDVPAGTNFTAQGERGFLVTARTEVNQKKGDKKIKLLYNQDLPCHVGGLPSHIQDREGCFESFGTLSFAHRDGEYDLDYSYDKETGNTNERTIHAMSFNAARKFRIDGLASHPYFHDFQKFVDFYGIPEFADRMIDAAMNAGKFAFQEGEFVFEDATREERADFIQYVAAYMNIGMFIQTELENALEKCANHCQNGDCHHAAIHGLDAAVAFYVGSLAEDDSSGKGNLMYGLADNMCKHFKTCGPEGNQIEGTAKVNYDIFEEFNEMRNNLENDMCVEAQKNKENIIKHMSIPMIQGFKLSVYKRTEKEESFEVENAAAFSAGVLPLLGYCKMEDAKQIQLNFSPGNEKATEDLDQIYAQLDEHYECMGVCCSDIGGLWDKKHKNYYKHTSPCIDTWDHCKPKEVVKERKVRSKKWMLYVLLVAAAVTGYLYRKRMKEIKRRKRAEATGEYEDDDSDNSSIDSHEGQYA